MAIVDRISKIRSIIAIELSIKSIEGEPQVCEIPVDAKGESFGLMINIYINPSLVSLSTIWQITVPILRRLFEAQQLQDFSWVAIQVVAADRKQDLGRVIRVETFVKELKNLRATHEAHLLDETQWEPGKFTCHWYWDKKQMLSTVRSGDAANLGNGTVI